MSRPIGVDLFAGVGGMSLGFEQAGFDIVAAVEIDPIHAAAHAFNFPSTQVIAKSVQAVTGEDIRRIANIGNRKVDVVFGGAPCQGFSLIGKRALDDPRNSLVRDFVRIVSELDATHFVFENVKGITVGKHRAFLDELISEFEIHGYKMTLPWKVLNAASYGTPQNRERLILMGTKEGSNPPVYPEEITTRPNKPGKLPLSPTCEEALSDIPDAELYSILNNEDEVSLSEWEPITSYQKELHCVDDKYYHYGYKRIWDRSKLTSSSRTSHTEISRRRFQDTTPGAVEPISRFFRLPPNGVCNTLRAGTDASRGAFTSPRPIHYKFNRCITVREMARLHGFPDWFRFHQTKWHGARQIGNAVPPPMARAIAGSICKALAIQPTQPDAPISLGNPDLLKMTMENATKYFGGAYIAAKRDRKSGATKRKQEEIEIERLKSKAA